MIQTFHPPDVSTADEFHQAARIRRNHGVDDPERRDHDLLLLRFRNKLVFRGIRESWCPGGKAGMDIRAAD